VAIGNPVGSVDPTQAAAIRLKTIQGTNTRLQKEVEKLRKQLATLKNRNDKNSQRIRDKVSQQLKQAQGQLAASGKSLATAQNSYYSMTGQYDKLLEGGNRDAYLAINALFKTYGLETLAPKIFEYVKNGYSSDTISVLLQDTAEYKARFAGNDARVKAGLPVLSAGEYLATEASYRQIMESAGLPIGFYDQPADFTKWIAKNVSPSEIQSRVDLASQATALASPFYKKALNQMGISTPELTAYFLDQERALPLLQKSAATAQIGAAALQQGLTFDQSYAEQLATTGVTGAQAAQSYQQVAGELETLKDLGSIYSVDWTQRKSEEAAFGTNAAASAQKSGLVARERGAFSSATGGARGGLAQQGGAK
jgi:hypothetical protein